MKKNIREKLAILGGKRTINAKESHFIWPKINKRIERAVVKQLYDNISIYNNGGIFKEFEEYFANYHNRKKALLCSSGTLAIHSMFVAADFRKGDEIIFPAYTFFATATPILQTGAKPILCDCDENGNIDPSEIEKKITKKTKAVVVTHMWGIPCQMDKIVKICKKNKILLLEDCSHAHGAKYKNKPVGSFGDLAAWSLQGQKNITGGEGGIITTNNLEFYYRALLLGHYNKRCKQEIPKNNFYHKFAVTGMGLKYRAHPLAVAIAFELMKEIEKTNKIRKILAKKMIKNLINIKGLKLPPAFLDQNIKPSWYAFTFQYDGLELEGLSLTKISEALWAEGLSDLDLPGSTCPLNMLPLFQKPGELFPIYKDKEAKFSYKIGDFPRAEKFYNNAIKLPVGTTLQDEKLINLYLEGIKKVFKNYDQLQK